MEREEQPSADQQVRLSSKVTCQRPGQCTRCTVVTLECTTSTPADHCCEVVFWVQRNSTARIDTTLPTASTGRRAHLERNIVLALPGCREKTKRPCEECLCSSHLPVHACTCLQQSEFRCAGMESTGEVVLKHDKCFRYSNLVRCGEVFLSCVRLVDV